VYQARLPVDVVEHRGRQIAADEHDRDYRGDAQQREHRALVLGQEGVVLGAWRLSELPLRVKRQQEAAREQRTAQDRRAGWQMTARE
jgi:hypothetical protein